jgi:hypothetical protein
MIVTASVEVAARVVRVPEAAPVGVERAVGERDIDAVRVGESVDAEATRGLGVVAAVAVEEDEERPMRHRSRCARSREAHRTLTEGAG